MNEHQNDDGEDGDLIAVLLCRQGRYAELLEWDAKRRGKVSWHGEVSDHWIEVARNAVNGMGAGK